MKCILCNSSKTSLKYHKNNYHYYLCAYCNSLFIGNAPSEDTLRKYYEENFDYSYDSETKRIISHEAGKSLRKLLRLNAKGNSLLDIGVGNGEFIEEAMRVGLKCKGIEPSKDLHTKLKNNIRRIVDNYDIKDFLRKDSSKYDFISLIHVVEHLMQPQELVAELCKRLNKNGVLLIETPNLDSWLFKIEGCEYTFLTPPDHICLFSPESLRYILKSLPKGSLFKLKIETYSYTSHIIGTIRGLINFRKRKQLNTPTPIENMTLTTISNTRPLRSIIGTFLSQLIKPFYNAQHSGSIMKGYFIRT